MKFISSFAIATLGLLASTQSSFAYPYQKDKIQCRFYRNSQLEISTICSLVGNSGQGHSAARLTWPDGVKTMFRIDFITG